ncbi:MAG: aminotransferase class III-fold pyridoxal phosphate-dependent enzyme [Eubacteriales bacterium]|nr:aminotransferase class III-fold pyridoxal phosphate-dependent enzyme [Eubacteriales bacterium]MDD4390671.1 aminotransferase class III-fold pyridoxal phosphate-dependent enzyme [Eubacteriales bacterium]
MTREEKVRAGEARYISKAQKIPYYDMVFESGKGALLYDTEGNEYIDLLASAGSANTGNGNIEIADAVYEQMKKICQITPAYVYTEKNVELAKKLTELAPGDFEKKVAFGLSGSDSIDGAIKFAKGFTKRNRLISFKGSYHGSTYGAISLSAISINMRKKLDPIPDVVHFSYPTCYMCPYDKNQSECNLECLNEIKEAFTSYLPSDEVAAIFFEPIAGDAGIICPPKKFVQALAALCKEHGILLVSDEIQQGFGRSGKWFAIEHFDVAPDMIVCGKSAGGGLPMGAVIGRREILDSLDPPAHLFTLGGNTTVCVAALKAIEIIERDNLLGKAAENGTYFLDKLKALQPKYDVVGDVRGLGFSIALDFVETQATMKPDRNATLKVCWDCVQNGVFITFLGKGSLRIQPPLVITREQIDRCVEVFESAIKKLVAGEIPDSVLSQIKGW